jgi:hypothetical protein
MEKDGKNESKERNNASDQRSAGLSLTNSSESQVIEKKPSTSSPKDPKSMAMQSNSEQVPFSISDVSDVSHKKSFCNEVLSSQSHISSCCSSRRDLQSNISQPLLQSSYSQTFPNISDSLPFLCKGTPDGLIDGNNKEEARDIQQFVPGTRIPVEEWKLYLSKGSFAVPLPDLLSSGKEEPQVDDSDSNKILPLVSSTRSAKDISSPVLLENIKSSENIKVNGGCESGEKEEGCSFVEMEGKISQESQSVESNENSENDHLLLIGYENINNMLEEKEKKEENLKEIECLEENEYEVAFRIRKRARLNKKDKKVEDTEEVIIKVNPEEMKKEKVEDVLGYSGEEYVLPNANNSDEKEKELIVTESSENLMLSCSDFSSRSKNFHSKPRRTADDLDGELGQSRFYGLTDGPSILNESLLGQTKNTNHLERFNSLDSTLLENSLGFSEYDNSLKGHLYRKSTGSSFLLPDSSFRHRSRSSLGLSSGVDTYTAVVSVWLKRK